MNRKTVIHYVQEYISEAIIKEEHNKMIHLHVSTNVSLYKIFTVLEKAREELRNLIEDYTVTQVTLDDIFVNFARMQEENELLKKENKQESFYKLVHRKANTISKFNRYKIPLIINNFLAI